MKLHIFLGLAFSLISSPSFSQDKAVTGDIAYGEYLAQECATCHRADGKMQGIPPIVGYPAESFIEFMNEYKTKKRPNTQMQAIAAKFSDDELKHLAAFYEAQKPK
jgi:cytochrome c